MAWIVLQAGRSASQYARKYGCARLYFRSNELMLRFILCGKDYAFLLATAGENPHSSPTDRLEWGARHPAWAVGFVPSLKGLDPLDDLYPALTRWADYSSAFRDRSLRLR